MFGVVGLAAASALLASSAGQTVSVTRPPGEFYVEFSDSVVTVVDTRLDAPPWTLSGAGSHAQQGGVGMARVAVTQHGDAITITVI